MTYIFGSDVIYSAFIRMYCCFFLLMSLQLYAGQTKHKEQLQNTAFECYIYKTSNYMATHGQTIGFVSFSWQPEELPQHSLEEIVIGSPDTEKSAVCVPQRNVCENCIVQLLRFMCGCAKIKKD